MAVIGGQRREMRVTPDLERMEAYRIPLNAIWKAIAGNNQRYAAGRISKDNAERIVEAGELLRNAEDLRAIVVGAAAGKPVFLRDVARVEDTGAEPSECVFHVERGAAEAAVTIAVAKRKGANAITVADGVLRKVELAKGHVLPGDVTLSISRQYGETAAEKSNELLQHMGIAVISVALLITLALGWRESLVVFAAVPVTLALTLTVFYLYGYTLNRITLFALIFSIGILVDDAIVVVENIVRHARLPVSRSAILMDSSLGHFIEKMFERRCSMSRENKHDSGAA
ncbi:MAG: efflux RND transporter permease subunit, partial [Acidobacteria bacterium]|nr:efflux RND transporter permease subunit [Acidobacteriota bacterium]